MKLRKLFISLLLPALTLGALNCGARLAVYDLRCDTMTDPLGIDSTGSGPGLSWKLRADENGQRQTGWQILVASSLNRLADDEGDLWDSGRQLGDEQLHVPYGGERLASSAQVFWKVRVWDAEGNASAWSKPATWTMGVLAEGDWQAQWITDSELLRWKRGKIGYHSEKTDDPHEPKWIMVDLGESHSIETVRLYPVRQTIEEAQGLPLGFVIEVANEPDFSDASILADHSQEPFKYTSTNHKTTVPTFDAPEGGLSGRYVRVSTNQLRRDGDQYYLALSQIEVVSEGRNVAPGSKVTARDSLEVDQWSAASVVDGLDVRGSNPRDNATLLARRELSIDRRLKRALVHISGLGHYELTVNGRKVGENLLSPGWTTYEKVALYETHDVTDLLRNGNNAIGVELAGGMYNVRPGRYVKFESLFRPLTVKAQIRLEFDDGRIEYIGTDKNWKLQTGPITFSNMFGGEDFDARLFPQGWNEPGFDDSGWIAATEYAGPEGELRGASHSPPPLRTHETFEPIAVNWLSENVAVYDMGQNVSMMPRLRVRGPAGSVVKMIPAELLNDDGTVYRVSVSRGKGEAWWSYTLKGDPAGEEWFPKFFYHGSRYLQVELSAPDGAPLPVVETLKSVVVHGSSRPAGNFACSNDLFNRIRTLIRWAQRSNTVSVFTDCPHREKLGWLEQYHLNGPSLRYEYDLERLFAKTLDDMAAAQTAEGLVPDIAPEYVIFSDAFRDSPEWGSAFILAAWQQYVWSGDPRPLQLHYEAMCRYLGYLRAQSENGILDHGLGDWYDIGPKGPGRSQLTPVALTATATFYEDLKTMGTVAELLGKADDARRFAAEANAVKQAFNREFYNPATGTYATGSQCANSMPLYFDLVPTGRREAVVEALVRDVQEKGLTAGDVGYRYLLRALAEAGRSDVIFTLNNQTEKPGYGYQLAQGATSLPESWKAGRNSSHNHFMLGQLMEWLYHDLAGIQPDPASRGFEKIIIQPSPVGDIRWVRASYESARGPISVAWRRSDGSFEIDISIPPNSTATIHLPGSKDEDSHTVGSGRHHFTTQL